MKSTLDLNLLKVLTLLYSHRRLKSVAKILDKSEGSVSKYLTRLREQFDDELFTLDSQNGYEPTPFMESILPEIEHGLELLDVSVNKKTFDPSTVTRTLVVAFPQYSQFYSGHLLLKRLMKRFPNARIQFSSWDHDTPEKILSEEIDLGIQLFNSELPKSLYQYPLGQFKYSIIVPEHLSHLSFEEACRLPFVVAPIKGWQYADAANVLMKEHFGVDINIVANIDNISCVFNSIREIDGATVLVETGELLEGFFSYPLNDVTNSFPKVMSVMKTKNRRNPLHQHLVEELMATMPIKLR